MELWGNACGADLQHMEPQLTIDQRFRLIEIAHETKDERVREEALMLLKGQRLMVAVRSLVGGAAS